ncbi:glycosyl transferase, group 1 family protein [unidentified eubacterium SCB49]|nr:glycosyl transferase, group 1 family protein [unidentified eubacterium SCB49]
MLKVLLITTEFPPQPGGIGMHSFAIATHLQAKGFEVTVSCDQRSKTGREEKEFDKKQAFLVVRNKRKKPIFRTYFNRIIAAKKHSKNTDVVIVSGKFSIWVGGLLKMGNTKVVSIVHGSELLLKNKYLKKITTNSLLKMDACISVSNYTASLLKDVTEISSKVIPNGFLFSKNFKNIEKIKPETLQLVTVGNVTQRKGQHNVINALPLLNKSFKHVTYKMAGLPSEKGRLIKVAKDKGVFDQINFLGRVSEEKKIELLQKSSIFVMLSEKTAMGSVEGFGIALIEANAVGIPTIGAKFCGIEDAIKDGYSGRLIDPHHPEEFLSAVEDIFENYNTYTTNAVIWASRFTWNQLIEDYISVLKKV